MPLSAAGRHLAARQRRSAWWLLAIFAAPLAAASALASDALAALGERIGDSAQLALASASEAAPMPNTARLETIVIEASRLGGPETSPTGANDYA